MEFSLEDNQIAVKLHRGFVKALSNYVNSKPKNCHKMAIFSKHVFIKCKKMIKIICFWKWNIVK